MVNTIQREKRDVSLCIYASMVVMQNALKICSAPTEWASVNNFKADFKHHVNLILRWVGKEMSVTPNS
jgi:hypothetical protein